MNGKYLGKCSLVLLPILLAGCAKSDSSGVSSEGDSATDSVVSGSEQSGSDTNLQDSQDSETADIQDGMVAVSQYHPTLESLTAAAQEMEHMTVADDFEFIYPENIESAPSFYTKFNALPYKEYYEQFEKVFAFSFPGKKINEDFLLYDGSYRDTGGLDTGVKWRLWKDYKDELEAHSGDEEDTGFFDDLYYDESHYDEWSDWENPPDHDIPLEDTVSLVLLNPPLENLCYINRGAIDHSEGRCAQQHVILEDTNWVGDYKADSTESFVLLDGKETRICDAAENLKTELERMITAVLGEGKTIDRSIDVMRVSVYRSGTADRYLYYCKLGDGYKGIRFDYHAMWGTVDIPAEYSGNYKSFDPSYAIMADGEKFDFLFGSGLVYSAIELQDEVDHEEIYSGEAALAAVREKMTENVDFRLEDAELLYLKNDGEDMPEGASDYVRPAWRFELYNPQDEFRYECIVSAIDLEDFMYRPMGQEEDDGE